MLLKTRSHRVLATQFQSRGFLEVKLPEMGEAVSVANLAEWNKSVGDFVYQDEILGVFATDKADAELLAPVSGVITKILVEDEDEDLQIGQAVIEIEPQDAPEGGPTPSSAAVESTPKEATPSSTPESTPEPVVAATPPPKAAPTQEAPKASSSRTRKVKMTPMRRTIAKRLKEAQNTAAMLTTFNEVDMSGLINMRQTHKDAFVDKYGVKLGFMSPFVVASTQALEEIPSVNAFIDGNSLVYNEFVNVGVAVASPKGLVVPVLRDCQDMSFADIENGIKDYAIQAKNGQLPLEDMTGGTFTISNGGVFGSLMGTPILNYPQSAILGMHATFERPVAVNGQIEIRPMMYIALTYDHRIIDGREAVTFLKSIKEKIQDPHRMLLGL